LARPGFGLIGAYFWAREAWIVQLASWLLLMQP
jgi:hypothetical protein